MTAVFSALNAFLVACGRDLSPRMPELHLVMRSALLGCWKTAKPALRKALHTYVGIQLRLGMLEVGALLYLHSHTTPEAYAVEFGARTWQESGVQKGVLSCTSRWATGRRRGGACRPRRLRFSTYASARVRSQVRVNHVPVKALWVCGFCQTTDFIDRQQGQPDAGRQAATVRAAAGPSQAVCAGKVSAAWRSPLPSAAGRPQQCRCQRRCRPAPQTAEGKAKAVRTI